jgi:hypothetical protein
VGLLRCIPCDHARRTNPRASSRPPSRDPYAAAFVLKDAVRRLSRHTTACGYGSRLGGRDDELCMTRSRATNLTDSIFKQPRHCERKRSNPWRRECSKRRVDCFVASAPRNDGKTQLRDLAAWFLREVYFYFPPSPNRGRRECRAPDAPDSRVCNGRVERTRVTGHTGITRHSPRNGLRIISCSPRCSGLFGHRRLQNYFRQLDTSVGVSGPHDFSVRFKRSRQKHHPRPPHPAPRFVTLRNAPLWDRTVVNIVVICISENQNIFSNRTGQPKSR